jgi:amidophosphoribosyltransferase
MSPNARSGVSFSPPKQKPYLRSPHGPREACGVVGLVAPGLETAKAAFFALYALQHRGQESAGIAVMGQGGIVAHKGMGLVTQVFTEKDLAPLRGDLALGHVRYSTAGSSNLKNAQPYVIHTGKGPLALAHNGNLTNARSLRALLLARGTGLTAESDSELLTQLLALPVSILENLENRNIDKPFRILPHAATAANAPNTNTSSEGVSNDTWENRLTQMMRLAEGAFSLVVLTADAVYALRDTHGFRPLHIGTLPLPDSSPGATGYVIASESCAFGPIGATPLREVEPGEIVRITRTGLTSLHPELRTTRTAFCSFEHVYFARPDSVLEGQLVHATRQRMGEILAREHPVDADLVIGVPDSALAAALGFARASGIPYGEGLIKNRYIGRTFIQPTAELRRDSVRLKYNPLAANLKGKRVVLVDDSIVRGTTAGPIVKMLRNAGAAAVHVRVSSPPVAHPCYMGVDMPEKKDLIASHLDPAAIADHIGADSCAYLSLAGLQEAIGHSPVPRHCNACFSGHYPVAVADLDPVEDLR